MVLIGVFLEGIELAIKRFRNDWFLKYEHKLETWGLIFWALVVIGLAWEFCEIAKSDKEAGELKAFAAQIGTTNALLVASNLVLRANVVELETQMAETKTNVSQIDPLNSPVTEISAKGFFLVKSQIDLTKPKLLEDRYFAIMTLGNHTSIFSPLYGSQLLFRGTGTLGVGAENGYYYDFQFSQDITMEMMSKYYPNVSVKAAFENVNMAV